MMGNETRRFVSQARDFQHEAEQTHHFILLNHAFDEFLRVVTRRRRITRIAQAKQGRRI